MNRADTDSPWWPAPAKLNLFLHITGRRADGYHELQTVFQLLDYGDRVRLRVRDDGQILRVTSMAGVPPEQDLTVRAARALQQHSGCPLGVDIEVDKRTPMGGGLGGGSSDAATVLVVLNRLWNLNLSTDSLAKLGLSLGADVPVFVRGESAWGEGVGERLTAVQLPETWFLVVSPGAHVSTVELFASPRLTRDARPITIRDYLAGAGSNVFEPLVRENYPAVNEAMTWLTQASGTPARMTGTGSSIFVAVESESRATQLLAKLPHGWQGFCARGVNRSPLLAQLER